MVVGSQRKSLLFTAVLIAFTIFLVSHHEQQHVAAMRPLEGEEYWMKKEDSRLVLQSLQRGPVPPAGGSPCTNIPGRGKGICTLNGKKFSGHVAYVHAPPAFPSHVMDVGVASLAGDVHPQHDLSS